MQIFVKGSTGVIHTLSISGNVTGWGLKQHREARYPGCDVDRGELVLYDKRILDSLKLSEQGVSEECTLVALPKASWTSGDMKWEERTSARYQLRSQRFDGG